jgi:hypothetical protein
MESMSFWTACGGQSAERVIIAGAKAGKDAVPISFVHIGS